MYFYQLSYVYTLYQHHCKYIINTLRSIAFMLMFYTLIVNRIEINFYLLTYLLTTRIT